MAIEKKYADVILPRIFEKLVLSDQITLIGGKDGQRIPINRSLLMANSKYFAAALGPNFNESGETEFILDETDGAMLKAIVDFCYTGRIELTEENVLTFLTISDSVELDLLNAKCRHFASKKMTRSNAMANLMIADKYNYQELHKISVNIISESFEDHPASDTNEWDWHLLHTILKENINLHVIQELVFNRLMEWFRHDEANRGQHMVESLKLIRLDCMPSQFLMDGQLEATYRQFNCFGLILAERRKREAETEDYRSQSRSIFSLIKNNYETEVCAERYNSVSNTFEDAGTINVRDRYHYNVLLHRNKVYVMGGRSYDGQNFMSRFDLITGEEEILPDMNEDRSHFATILLGKYIYVFGGRDYPDELNDSDDPSDSSASRVLNSCERFDLETLTWTMLKPMHVARDSARAIALNGYIYVVGGYMRDGSEGGVMVPELYDPINNEWHQLARMIEDPSGDAVFASKPFLYTSEILTPMQRYDISRNCWTQIPDLSRILIKGSVETVDGFFFMSNKGCLTKMSSDAEGVLSFETMARSRHEYLLQRENCLFLN